MDSLRPSNVALALVGLGAVLFAVYGPALRGLPVSDDFGFVFSNPYTATIDAETLVGIFDPRGAVAEEARHYNPLQYFLHALEMRAFGTHVFGHHAVNVVLHASNCALLFALLVTVGIPIAPAIAGVAIFALHPANVEAVAWISQLKTVACLALMLLAVLAHRTRPALGAVAYGLALLTKGAAPAALALAIGLTWSRSGGTTSTGGGSRRHWAWLGVWGLLTLGWMMVNPDTAQMWSVRVEDRYADSTLHLGSIAGYAGRYLVMATTSYGVSAFHDPVPHGPMNPWAALGLLGMALIAWRGMVSLKRRTPEAGFWGFAALSFLSVSQLVPFVHPMGDRYLYFMLPGFIGGGLLLGIELWPRLAARLPAGLSPALMRNVAVLGLAVVCSFFAARSHARAALWTGIEPLLMDSASQYPDSAGAWYLRARAAGRAGEAAQAVAALRRAEGVVPMNIKGFVRDESFEPVFADPVFQAYAYQFTGRLLELERSSGIDNGASLRARAELHAIRGELDEAIALLEEAARRGGRYQASVLASLDHLRRLRASRRGHAPAGPSVGLDALADPGAGLAPGGPRF